MLQVAAQSSGPVYCMHVAGDKDVCRGVVQGCVVSGDSCSGLTFFIFLQFDLSLSFLVCIPYGRTHTHARARSDIGTRTQTYRS